MAELSRTRRKRQSAAGRRKAGLVRLDLWVPRDVAESLEILCKLEAQDSHLPPERCRTAAISKVIREAAFALIVDGRRIRDARDAQDVEDE